MKKNKITLLVYGLGNLKKNKMKIWHISDSHTYHELLNIPSGIDMVIHSGDCSNPRDSYKNEPEVKNFIHWFKGLPIKHKIYVAGNHDASIEKRLVTKKDFEDYNIHYLENDFVILDGLTIWGSPYSPTFGNWCFMKSRDKLNDLWKYIPEFVDIVVTHTPPKGVLDLSYSRQNVLEYCGCRALANNIKRVNPKLHLFGHIHNVGDIINAGYLKHSNGDTVYSNGSVVTDGKFGVISSNGNIFEL